MLAQSGQTRARGREHGKLLNGIPHRPPTIFGGKAKKAPLPVSHLKKTLSCENSAAITAGVRTTQQGGREGRKVGRKRWLQTLFCELHKGPKSFPEKALRTKKRQTENAQDSHAKKEKYLWRPVENTSSKQGTGKLLSRGRGVVVSPSRKKGWWELGRRKVCGEVFFPLSP